MELTWNITQMSCYPEQDGLTDVVFSVSWSLTATDDTYTSSVNGTIGVELDPAAPYTPYNELTKDQVLGWVKSSLGDAQVLEYENGVSSIVEAQKNPTIVTPALPWSAPIETLESK
jgi:hypothetical protein